jgi:hypothetical protein
VLYKSEKFHDQLTDCPSSQRAIYYMKLLSWSAKTTRENYVTGSFLFCILHQKLVVKEDEEVRTNNTLQQD